MFTNGTTTLDYFSHFNLSLITQSGASPGLTAYFTNFLNGQQINSSVAFSGDIVTAFTTYTELLANYSYINGAWDLPDPVPEDLLLTWGDFVAKYKLEAMQTIVYTYNPGQGNILAQLAFYVLRQLSLPQVLAISSGFLVNPAGNQVLYDRALAELGSSAFLNAKVDSVTRSDSGVELCVTNPDGQFTIKAKKLILAIPPLLRNLPFMDLDDNEQNLFGQFNSSFYYNALVENAGLPANSSYLNLNPAAPLLMPAQPAIYIAGDSGVPGLTTLYYGSAHPMSDEVVKADIKATLARLRRSTNSTAPSGDLEFVGFNNHSPYTLTVTPEAIRGGFYADLKALQGEKRTWYTGAMWANDASGEIWNFTEHEILPKVVALE